LPCCVIAERSAVTGKVDALAAVNVRGRLAPVAMFPARSKVTVPTGVVPVRLSKTFHSPGMAVFSKYRLTGITVPCGSKTVTEVL